MACGIFVSITASAYEDLVLTVFITTSSYERTNVFFFSITPQPTNVWYFSVSTTGFTVLLDDVSTPNTALVNNLHTIDRSHIYPVLRNPLTCSHQPSHVEITPPAPLTFINFDTPQMLLSSLSSTITQWLSMFLYMQIGHSCKCR